MKSDKQKALFDSLVRNALDFLRESILDLEQKPKYSVINFCSGVEIFLKARLMREHWTLIVTNPKNPKFHNLENGQLTTVGIDDAIKLLESVVETKILEEAKKCFEEISTHRNRNIHFFPADDNEKIQRIVGEQLKSWIYLYQLLSNDWKDIFDEFRSEISEIDQLLLENKRFLSEKYEILSKTTIKEYISRGSTIIKCYVCEYVAAVEKENLPPFVETDCLVCTSNMELVRVTCSNCEKNNYFLEGGNISQAKCKFCNMSFEIEDLASQGFEIGELLSVGFTAHQIILSSNYLTEDLINELTERQLEVTDITAAYCRDCEYDLEPSVLRLGESWMCVECQKTYDSISVCDWCGEPIAGYIEDDTYVLGCGVHDCDGSVGYQSAKDD